MRGIIIFILLITLILPTYGLSLDEAIQLAKENNQEILAARKIWQAAKDNVGIVSTWPKPQLELMYEQIPQAGGSLADASMKMVGLSQRIPFPGKLTLKRIKADQEAKALAAEYLLKQQKVIAQVKTAYYDLFFVERAIVINEKNKTLLENFARVAEAKYVVGKAIQHDVLQAKIALALLDEELINLKQRLQTAKTRLNTLLNRPADTAIDLPDELDVPQMSYSLEQLQDLGLASRPQLNKLIYQLKQTETALTLAKTEFLPDFKAGLWQRETKATGLAGWNASFMLDLPLYFWRESSAVAAAGAKHEAALATYNDEKNMTIADIEVAWQRIDEARRKVKLYQATVIPQAKQALKAAIKAYESNAVDFLTLINSQKVLLHSELNNYRALADWGKSLAKLEQEVGLNLTDKGGEQQ